MAPKGSSKEKGKARAKMPTSGINRRLLLDRDFIKGFLSEHIRGLIWIYNFCGVQDESAWDLFYDIISLDAVTIRHFPQFQLMWPHCRSRSSPFRGGGLPSTHTWGKCLTKPATKWTIGGRTIPVPSAIKSIAPIRRQPARGRLNAPVSVSPGMVAMISGQRLSSQAVGSTNQATSWPLDHWIGMG